MSAIELRTATDDAEAWVDYEGRWSAFNLQVGNGTQRQNFRFVPSTSSYTAWLPPPGLCADFQRPIGPCSLERGIGLYEGQQSTGFLSNRSASFEPHQNTKVKIGPFDGSDIFGLGYDVNTTFGSDVLWIQDANNTWIRGPRRSPILSTPSELYSSTMLGLGFGNFELVGEVFSSFTKSLSDLAMIPSRSWGYTAGASYRNNGLGVRGSLVLGGFDATQVETNSTTTFQIPGGADGSHTLVVNVAGIRIGQTSGISQSETEPFDAIIDSTLPYLYLPNRTVDMFVEQFGLVANELGGVPEIFLVSEANITANRGNTSDISFLIKDAVDATNTNIQTIRFPYDAFDVPLHWSWGQGDDWRIFPIRRQQSGQYAVLGRAFLQEAYIHANFEPDVMRFNISQRAYPASNVLSDIQTVHATPSRIINNGDKGLARGAVAGIVIGAVAAVALALFTLWWFLLRRRRAKAKADAAEKAAANKADPFPMIDGDIDSRRGTETCAWLSEVDGTHSSYAASLLRPGHGRHESYASELSSDSDHGGVHAKMLMATLHERHELEGGQAVSVDEHMKIAGGSADLSPRSQPMRPAELPASTDWPLLDVQPTYELQSGAQKTTTIPAITTHDLQSSEAPATTAPQQAERAHSRQESRFSEAVDTEPSLPSRTG